MANYRPGPLVSGISGSVGGITFTTGGRTSKIGERAQLTNRLTVAQETARARMAYVRHAWSTLTAAQRQAWNNAAALVRETNSLGVERSMRGVDAFTRANMYGRMRGAALISTPPARLVGVMPSASQFRMQGVGQNFVLITTLENLGAGALPIMLWGCATWSNRAGARLRNWRYLGYVASGYGWNNPVVGIPSILGYAPANSWVGLRVMSLFNCCWSPIFELRSFNN